MIEQKSPRPRILSGMRPTGKLHLGNLVGALQNWIALQDQYESYHFVADWHMLTTDYADTSGLQTNIQEMVTDWLAAGLDPAKSTFFIQSRLPEHAELQLLFSMVTPLGWLERVPSYKEQLANIKDRDLTTYGFLGYPVLQAADILMYKADAVPVGEDQVPRLRADLILHLASPYLTERGNTRQRLHTGMRWRRKPALVHMRQASMDRRIRLR